MSEIKSRHEVKEPVRHLCVSMDKTEIEVDHFNKLLTLKIEDRYGTDEDSEGFN